MLCGNLTEKRIRYAEANTIESAAMSSCQHDITCHTTMHSRNYTHCSYFCGLALIDFTAHFSGFFPGLGQAYDILVSYLVDVYIRSIKILNTMLFPWETKLTVPCVNRKPVLTGIKIRRSWDRSYDGLGTNEVTINITSKCIPQTLLYKTTESQNLDVSRLGLQLSLCNIFKPSVKWRMTM